MSTYVQFQTKTVLAIISVFIFLNLTKSILHFAPQNTKVLFWLDKFDYSKNNVPNTFYSKLEIFKNSSKTSIYNV